MDPLAPARRIAGLGLNVAVTGIRLATHAPRIAAGLLGHHSDDDHAVRAEAGGTATATAPPPPPADPARPSPQAPRGRAGLTDAAVEATKGPPEPTSAAGASGGVAGTAAAPAVGARAGAPDPTAATTTRRTRPAPATERRQVDVEPVPAAARHTPEVSRAEATRLRTHEREAAANAEEDAVLSLGDGEPGAQLHVDAPWEGYDKMRAADVVDRLKTSDEAVRAVVLLYEQTHRKRKSVLSAAGAT